MSQKSGPRSSAEQHVREIRRQTRKQYSAEEKIRIVLEGLRGEYSIAELVSTRRDRTRASITNGLRSSSRPARSACQATPSAKPHPVRSKNCVSEMGDLKEALGRCPCLKIGCSKKASIMDGGDEDMRYPCIRKAGDHPPCRAVTSAGQAHASQARRFTANVLSLV